MNEILLLLLLAAFVIIFLGASWIFAEVRNKSVATRIALGAAMNFSVAASIIGLWFLDAKAKHFYDYDNFGQVIYAADEALQQGKAQQVQTILAAFGEAQYTSEGVWALRESLIALTVPRAVDLKDQHEKSSH